MVLPKDEAGAGRSPRPTSVTCLLGADTPKLPQKPPSGQVISFPERRDGVFLGFGGREFCHVSPRRLRLNLSADQSWRIRRMTSERRWP
jgi:hypothetical protein